MGLEAEAEVLVLVEDEFVVDVISLRPSAAEGAVLEGMLPLAEVVCLAASFSEPRSEADETAEAVSETVS